MLMGDVAPWWYPHCVQGCLIKSWFSERDYVRPSIHTRRVAQGWHRRQAQNTNMEIQTLNMTIVVQYNQKQWMCRPRLQIQISKCIAPASPQNIFTSPMQSQSCPSGRLPTQRSPMVHFSWAQPLGAATTSILDTTLPSSKGSTELFLGLGSWQLATFKRWLLEAQRSSDCAWSWCGTGGKYQRMRVQYICKYIQYTY